MTVRVTDNGEPPVTATAQFEVSVREVNVPPVLAAVPDQRVGPLDTLRLQLSATDTDEPTNALTYALVEGPPGLSVSPAGLLEWAPPAVARPSVHRVVVRVTDDGTPSLAGERDVTVIVASVPPTLEVRLVPAAGGAPARVEIRLPTDAGWTYRLEAADSLPADAWITVASLSGTGGTGVLADEVAGAPSRYYRVVVE